MCVYIFHLPKPFFRLDDQVLVQDLWPQRQTGVQLGWGAKKVRWTEGKGWRKMNLLLSLSSSWLIHLGLNWHKTRTCNTGILIQRKVDGKKKVVDV